MKKHSLIITFAITLCIASCCPQTKLTVTNGYYYGEKGLLFPCFYFLEIRDSTAFVEVYMNFQNVVMTHNIIDDVPVRSLFPYSTKFFITKEKNQIVLIDSVGNRLSGIFISNGFYLKKPKRIKFNKLDSVSNSIDKKRNLTLYNLALYYPDRILNKKDTMYKTEKSYLSRKVGKSKFLYQKCFEINYNEYKAMLADSVNYYYINYKP